MRGTREQDGIKFAVAQLDAAPFAPAENAARGAAAIHKAAASGAEVIVLPELMSTGYVLDRERIREFAEPLPTTPRGPCGKAWSTAARENHVVVVAGMAERTPNGCYNSAVVFDRTGEILKVYRKLHLFAGERDAFLPGDGGLPIVEISGLRLGLLICYDLRFPESLRILALRGADVVALPTAWVAGFDREATATPETIPQVVNATVQANLNQIWIAAAGRCGRDDGTELLGSSLIVDPYGGVVAGPLDRATPGIAIAEVRREAAALAHDRGSGIRPRQDRRIDVYGELLGYDEESHG